MAIYLKVASTALLLCFLWGCATDSTAPATTTRTNANTPTASPKPASIKGSKVSVSPKAKHTHHSTRQRVASKGIGLSYNQVTHLIAGKFNIQEGIPVDGRRSSSGQNGYKGPAIQIIGDHDDVWEAGLLIQMPQHVPSEVVLANASSLASAVYEKCLAALE